MAVIAQSQKTLVDLNDPVQQGTVPANPVTGLLWLDTSQSPPILKRYTGAEWEVVNEVSVGGRNLILDSEEIVIEPNTSNYHYVTLHSPLEQGVPYTFSVGGIELTDGTSAGVTLLYYDLAASVNGGQIAALAYESTRQSVTFTPRVSAGNTWGLLVYAGIYSATSGVGIILRKAKLERGTVATDWTRAPEDDEEQIELKITETRAQISTTADSIRQEVQASYASASDMSNVRQQLTTLAEQTDSSFSWTVTQLNALSQNINETQLTEEQVEIVQTYMSLTGNGLVMGKTGNPVSLRILNDRVAFYMNNTEVAYLSNNKLYVTQAEILTKLQIGQFAFEPQSNGNLSVIYTG